MEIFVSILIILTSVLLILIVLVQNSKGGGLTSNFSSSNQVMGYKKTADFLEKATWSLAIALVVFCIAASVVVLSKPTANESAIKTHAEQQASQLPAGNLPVQQNQQQQGQPQN